jgi:hypothetical protein
MIGDDELVPEARETLTRPPDFGYYEHLDLFES